MSAEGHPVVGQTHHMPELHDLLLVQIVVVEPAR